ncbi:class I SAM-dependent methyltransferase [Termitidicoccus mucosus]|uniref:SAM-dependent methyltransferase n=1 Tax=Termitidicoccus mucosus TaxID=1184151 RepID=A0A178IG07_9BACT|nr:SAM-dependent methyltransferase [Opitutaceae bacterium TSB47]
MDADHWNERYAATGHFYGTEPNGFLAAMASLIPDGSVLCLAEGEGRNAVHLATLGHRVTAVDQSSVGLDKAQRLAATWGVTLETVVTDLATYPISPGRWAGIISIFAHLPSPLRRNLHAAVVHGLKPGGIFILEAYTPAQLAFNTGGPKDLVLLMQLDDLHTELAGLNLLVAREIERDVVEGPGHRGRAAIVQVVGRKPQK